MAITFGGISSRGASSLTIGAGANPFLIVAEGTGQSSFSFGSQAMTALGSATDGVNTGKIWYLANPTTGSSQNFSHSVSWAAYYYGATSMQFIQSAAASGNGSPIDLYLNNNFGGAVGSDIWGMLFGLTFNNDNITVTAAGFSQRATFNANNSQFYYDSNGALSSGINTLQFSTFSGHTYIYLAAFIYPHEDYTVSAAVGTFSLTGGATALINGIAHFISVAVGTFTLTGYTTTLTWYRKWINALKDSTSFSNKPKSSASSWSNKAKDTTTFTNKPKH
jgi:hypothetical protein